MRRRIRRQISFAKLVCKDFALEEDTLLALRYSYYVLAKPLIEDADYDKWEKEYLPNAPKDSLLHKPGSDKASDYPKRVQALALYYQMKFSGR